MSATILQIDKADVRFGDCPGPGIPLDPTLLTDYSCQVTRAEITSSSNTTTTSVPATFCQPASERSVPVASTFQLNLDFLQDWTSAAGLSAYLFANDATSKCFALYLKNQDNPVATGEVIVQAGAFGGTPGEALTASVTLNIQGYPDIKDATGASLRPTAGGPGDVSASYPAAAAIADLATLKADATSGDAGSGPPYNGGTGTAAAFAAGEFVTLAGGTQAYWDGSAWQAGAAPGAPAANPLDLSSSYAAAAAMADLATLKADATSGDTGTGSPYNGGTGTDAAFTTGQFITLADASLANWDGSAWQQDAAT